MSKHWLCRLFGHRFRYEKPWFYCERCGLRIHNPRVAFTGVPMHGATHGYDGRDPITKQVFENIQKFRGVYWFNNNWVPAGMIWNTVSGSGSIDWYCDRVVFATGTTSDSYACVQKEAVGLTGACSWDKKRYFGVNVKLLSYSALNAHIVTGMTPYTGSANTDRHVGFKLVNADLYGTTGNASSESTLLLETLTAEVTRTLECVLDPGIPECRFYVDGVDKGVITTNLPTGSGDASFMLRATIHNTEAVNKNFNLYESRTYQEG